MSKNLLKGHFNKKQKYIYIIVSPSIMLYESNKFSGNLLSIENPSNFITLSMNHFTTSEIVHATAGMIPLIFLCYKCHIFRKFITRRNEMYIQ